MKYRRLILKEIGFNMSEREIHQGEIYWSNQPFMKGHLQKNSRPYLVASSLNNKGYVTILPITSKIKRISNRFDIKAKNRSQQVILDQPQTVLISTLGRYFDKLEPEEVNEVLVAMFDYFFCFK